MSDLIGQWVSEQIASQNEAIESACERMLVTPGDWGVLVESWPDRWRVSLTNEQPYEPMTINYQRHP